MEDELGWRDSSEMLLAWRGMWGPPSKLVCLPKLFWRGKGASAWELLWRCMLPEPERVPSEPLLLLRGSLAASPCMPCCMSDGAPSVCRICSVVHVACVVSNAFCHHGRVNAMGL